jgi:hypothetical protein
MHRFATATALALGAGAAPACAEIAAEEVWSSIRGIAEDYGYVVEAAEETTGTGLMVRDFVLSVDIPEEDGSVSLFAERIEFVETGDGRVRIAFPTVLPAIIDYRDADESGEIVIEFTHDGLEVLASGAPEALLYDFAALSMGVELAEVSVDGIAMPPEMAEVEITMGPVAGQSEVIRGGGMMTTLQEASLGRITYAMGFAEPGGGDRAQISGSVRSVNLTSAAEVPEGVDLADFDSAVAAGFSSETLLSHDGGAMTFETVEDGSLSSGSSTSTGGSTGFALSGTEIAYSFSVTGTQIALASGDFPLPIELSAQEIALAFTMPTAPGDEPSDAELAFMLDRFAPSDVLWNMFDPGAILPRAPASIALEAVAQITPLADIFDPEAMATLGPDAAPATLHALSLNTLVVDAVGALVTGEGAFTFDNSDLETFNGMPRPEGRVSLEINGVNGLIDALIAMGLMTEQDALGMRMMLSMFTVPGAAPDTATSVIEINEAGHILANGQRIQ